MFHASAIKLVTSSTSSKEIVVELDLKRLLVVILISAFVITSLYGYIGALYAWRDPTLGRTADVGAYFTPSPSNKKPIADAGSDRKSFVGRRILFDGSRSRDPDGTIWTYLWEFGDGEKSTQVKKEHVYDKAGNYTVTLTVKDRRRASDTDTITVFVEELPLEPVGEVDAAMDVEPKENYVMDAKDEAGTTLTLNSTGQCMVWVFKYSSNPHPEVPRPNNSLPTVVDIAVSDKGSISWPMYIERSYTDEDVAELNESALGIYYYKGGAWRLCRETGVYTDLNNVWANMYEDEVTGSLTIIGERPVAATFEVALALEPEEVGLGEEATVTFNVTNVGDETGNYTWILIVNGDEVESGNVTLTGEESKNITRTLSYYEAGAYLIEMGGLAARLKVTAFEVALSLSPEEVKVREEAFVTITVTNLADVPSEYTWILSVDGVEVESGMVSLVGKDTETITRTLSYDEGGTYSIEADGLSADLTVTALRPAEFVGLALSISPEEVEPGEDVLVSVNVENVGEEQGSHDVEFKMDDVAIVYEPVTLDAGESTRVEATLFTEEEGEHTVEAEGLTGSFTVVAPPSRGIPWIPLLIILVVITIVGAYFYIRED